MNKFILSLFLILSFSVKSFAADLTGNGSCDFVLPENAKEYIKYYEYGCYSENPDNSVCNVYEYNDETEEKKFVGTSKLYSKLKEILPDVKITSVDVDSIVYVDDYTGYTFLFNIETQSPNKMWLANREFVIKIDDYAIDQKFQANLEMTEEYETCLSDAKKMALKEAMEYKNLAKISRDVERVFFNCHDKVLGEQNKFRVECSADISLSKK
jgi:hypothetical protein